LTILTDAAEVQDVHVKWPNDVWVGYKKLSGVLINASITGAEAIAQIGIGVRFFFLLFYFFFALSRLFSHSQVNVNENMSQASSDEVRDVATSVAQCLGMEVGKPCGSF
jgi:hypothetical protein